jgi:hypothetical protein
MKCDEIPLLELIRGELDRKTASRITSHLEACRTCRERAAVMAVLETRPEIERLSGRWHSFYLVAAVLALAVLGGGLAFWVTGYVGGASDADSLATTQAYPLVPLVTRGEPGPSNLESREKAYDEYRAGHYEAAAHLLRRLPLGADSEFYLGVSLYLAGDPLEAREHLAAAERLSERWREPAGWYLANVDLKLNRIEAAKEAFEEIRKRGGEFSIESARILERLRNVGS